MDERQQQIREGAGLEESRLNVEFIEFLRKWSTPLLLIAAVAALGWVVKERWERSQAAKVDQAFSEFETVASTNSPSPESLRRVADEFGGVRGVPHLARLEAADAYLRSVRTGIKPGAAPGPDGMPVESDLMTDEDRAANLTQAEDLYRAVFEATRSATDKALFAIGAGYGLAAVAESRGDLEAARARYEDIAAIAEKAKFLAHATIARERLERLDTLKETPRLFAEVELPKLPWREPPPAPPVDPGEAATPAGESPPGEEPTPAIEEPAAPPTDAPPTDAPPAEPEPTEPPPGQPDPASPPGGAPPPR